MALLIDEHGEGRLRKMFGVPVVGLTDPAYRIPPQVAKFAPDGVTRVPDPTSTPCGCGSDPLQAAPSEPEWATYGLKHCFVGEDAVTGLLKPVTAYATVAAFLLEAVGVCDGISYCEHKPITVFKQGVIRLWLETPAAVNLTDMYTLEVDPGTTNLHMFRTVITADPAEAIGRAYSARTELKSYVDVYFNFVQQLPTPVVAP